ncbi:conserved hypothetical protein [Arthrobacter sp. Hiyo4]|nr:conserved hypothetical protein [Arthrobacter sp. Hiyo4]
MTAIAVLPGRPRLRKVSHRESSQARASRGFLRQSFKDPYVFDFVAMTGQRNERELEGQLVVQIEKFLLELGQGLPLSAGKSG